MSTLAARLNDPRTIWQRVQVARWYGEGSRMIEIASDTAVWYHTGLPPVSIRWVLIRDPLGRFAPQALLSTDMRGEPLQSLEWSVQRWPLEVTFEEVRAHLGVETQRQWSDLASARTTPVLLGLSLPRPRGHGDKARQWEVEVNCGETSYLYRRV